jgi:hypothetical protein
VAGAADEKLVKIALGRQNPLMDETNPYLPPQAEILATDADASRVRYEHLRTESHLKALGWLTLSLAITQPFAKMLRMRFLGRMFDAEVELTHLPYEDMIRSASMLVIAIGLIKLQRWGGLFACVNSIIVMMLNMFELPTTIVGIIVHAVILRFLLSAKSRRVFSADYCEVIRLTPFLLIQAIALALMFWFYS